MNDRATHVYQEVVRGLVEDWSQIESLDRTLTALVADVREIERAAADPALPPAFDGDWNRIETLLTSIHDHVTRTRARLESTADVDGDAIAEWAPIGMIEAELRNVLHARKAANLFTPASRADWEAGWLALETYLATLSAHAKSVQVRLELRRRFGAARAAELTSEMLAKLPEDLRDAQGTEAFETAVSQLQADRQQFQGVWDIMKALALWVETPEERARKIRSAD